MHEQVVVAACDAGQQVAAAAALAPLQERFPGSQRVGALAPSRSPLASAPQPDARALAANCLQRG